MFIAFATMSYASTYPKKSVTIYIIRTLMFTTPLTMGEGKVERKTKYNKETLDWLERKSDKNLLSHYKNNLEDLPSSKRQELTYKGYIGKTGFNGKFSLTREGEELLNEDVAPPYL